MIFSEPNEVTVQGEEVEGFKSGKVEEWKG
jgi:hypothetical protein